MANNSDAIKSRGIAAQFTVTKARAERRDACEQRGDQFLPVPVSPLINTVASVGATTPIMPSMRRRRRCFRQCR